MNDVYAQLILSNASAASGNFEIAKSIAQLNEFDIRQAALRLSERDRKVAWFRIADRISAVGTIATLETGALLMLFEHTTDESNRGQLFAKMSSETGISRTQLYRTLDMFHCFGRELLDDLDVAGRCTCEALKILSAKTVNPAARDAAWGCLRGDASYRLTIKEANRLRRQFATSPDENHGDPPGTGSNSGKPCSVLWQFEDPKVSVIVAQLKTDEPIDHEAILFALEAALHAYRSETVSRQSQTLVA